MSKITGIERFIVVANENINPELVLKVEKQSFVNEPPETREGIELLLQHGTVLFLNEPNVKAVAESIDLQKLISLDLSRLPSKSPLRMIWENDKETKVLSSIIDDYPRVSNWHYAHGISVSEKGLGYGTALFAELTKRVVKENELMLGFIIANPPNIPSLRMCLGQAAILDKVEERVYEPGKSYFRMVYNAKMNYASNAPISIALKDDNIILIQRILSRGYVCTEFKQPSWLSFNRNS